MRFPKHHIADQVVGRILAASHAMRGIRTPAEPADEPLSAKVIPPDIQTGYAGAVEAVEQQTPTQAQPPAELPGLDQSGLDVGAVLSGRDSIDALLQGKG